MQKNNNSTKNQLVNTLVKQDSSYHPNLGGITKGGIANHFSMAIIALQGIGGTQKDIKNFLENSFDDYRTLYTKLPLKDSNQINKNNWFNYLGDSQKALEFRRVFRDLLQNLKSNLKQTLEQILPYFINGLPMGLFHPIIRLQFALLHDKNDLDLIADALTYLAIRYQNIVTNFQNLDQKQDQSQNQQNTNCQEVWDYLKNKKTQIPQLQGGSIKKLEQIISNQEFQQLAFSQNFKINQNNYQQIISQIQNLVIKLYLNEPALTTLHAVTGFQAILDVNQYLNTNLQIQFLKIYWIWLTLLYIEKQTPKLPEIDQHFFNINKKELNWENLLQKTRNSGHIHVIKMTFSCYQLNKISENDLLKLAVANMLQNDTPFPNKIFGITYQNQ